MIRPILSTYRAAFSGLTREVWLLAAVALVNRSGSMVLPFLALYLTRDRGLTVVQAGSVLSLYGLGAILGAWIGGRLTDSIGAIRAQQISLLLSGAGFLLFGRLKGAAEIAVGVVVVSVAVEAFRPANMSAFAQFARPGTELRAFALLRLAASIGLTIGPAVGGFLALLSYRWLFVADALTCWAATILLAASLPSTAPAPTTATTPLRQGSPWSDGPFLLLMLVTVALAMVFFQLWGTVPLYFNEVCGLREHAIGMLLALNCLLIAAFEMVLAHWAERRRPLPLIGLGSFLVCLGFALMPFGRTALFLALTVVVWSVGEMLALPLLTSVSAGRSGPGNRGRYMGLYTMAFSVAFVLAPLVGTWVYGSLGPDVLWYAVGALGVPLGLAAWGLGRLFPDSAVSEPGRPPAPT